MSTHNPHEPDSNKPEEVDASKGYEASDVRVSGVLVFLVALSIFAAVTAVLAYGIGKVLNARMATEDGPRSKWARPVDVRPLGNMPSDPDLKNKLGELTQRFPTPRLQNDDGNQDVTDLHAREDLLLNNYTWVVKPRIRRRVRSEFPSSARWN